jgi:hypothetical protein
MYSYSHCRFLFKLEVVVPFYDSCNKMTIWMLVEMKKLGLFNLIRKPIIRCLIPTSIAFAHICHAIVEGLLSRLV